MKKQYDTSILRKRMYKKGKYWVVAGVASLLASGLMISQSVSADQTSEKLINTDSHISREISTANLGKSATVNSENMNVTTQPENTKELSEKSVIASSNDNQIMKEEPIQESSQNNPKTTVDNHSVQEPSVSYSSHIQDIGWQKPVDEGEISGTITQPKRLEAIKITVDSTYTGGVIYSSHVQDIGWQKPVREGQVSGTTGQSKRIEAIKVELTGELADNYDIYYRSYLEAYGWLGWAKNGEASGSQGLSKRLEAYQTKLIKKGTLVKLDTNNAFVYIKPSLTYTSHVEDIGWQSSVIEGRVSGTTGQSKRIEAAILNLSNKDFGNIQYRSHLQGLGWQGYVSSGMKSGTTGQNRRMEAIQIKLTGELAKKYRIKYRVHVQDIGWQDWVSDGEIAGTTGQSKRIEAYEVLLEDRVPVEKLSKYIETVAMLQRTQKLQDYKKIATQLLQNDIYVFKGTTPVKKLPNLNSVTSGFYAKGRAVKYDRVIEGDDALWLSYINYGGSRSYVPVIIKDQAMQIQILPRKSVAYALTKNAVAPYYSQRDYRWGGKYYGNYTVGMSGCVPTVLSMAFSALTNKQVLPTQVANYLYRNTNDYNKIVFGTRAPGIIKATNNWGLTASNLNSRYAIDSALKAGHFIAAATQNNIFVTHGSHELLLHGYRNGMTRVYDPYTSNLSGWYHMNYIFNTRSTESDDNRLGLPFFKISVL